MKYFTIKVTEEHIIKGKKGSPRFCPVALALTDALDPQVYRHIGVPGGEFGFDFSGNILDRNYVLLPEVVVDAIVAFDNSGIMKPFEFELLLATSSNDFEIPTEKQ